jgi:hypothetical protein
MGSEAAMVWSVLFGAIGVGFFMYGRKQRRVVPFVSGIGLIAVPYFVDGTTTMVAICVLLMVLPYFIRS